MHGEDVFQTTNSNGNESYSGKQNRIKPASKAVGLGSNPSTPAKLLSIFDLLALLGYINNKGVIYSEI